MSYSNLEYELFSRQFILKEFSEKNIEKLFKLKITIIGLGGIGCPLVKYLLSSGIRNFTLIDGDIVEKSNLNRQILFTIDDLGKKKVDVAKKILLKNNPKSIIKTIDKNINSQNINLLKNSSIVIDTIDNWENTKILNEFCVKNNITYLFSSVVGFDVQVGVFPNNKNNHVCLNCLFPNKKDVDLPRCNTVGISGITAGFAGLITAQKTLNFLLKFTKEINTLTLFNIKNLEFNRIKIKKNQYCSLNNS